MRILKDGKKLARPFLDICGRIASGCERGLLSLAFAPDYALERPLLRLLHGPGRRHPHRRVPPRERRARRPRLGRRLLSVGHPASNHNGGLVLFGPDGLLYAGLGDGGGRRRPARRARQRAELEHVCSARSLRHATRSWAERRAPEIYAYGVRNPWRFAFAPSGALVSPTSARARSRRSRWCAARARTSAGACSRAAAATRRARRRPGHLPPAIQRFHADGNCSITGGVVVRDPVLSALRGRYVFGDFCRGVIESARISGGKARDVRETSLTGRHAVLVRRGRPAPRLRDVAGRPGLPARPALTGDLAGPRRRAGPRRQPGPAHAHRHQHLDRRRLGHRSRAGDRRPPRRGGGGRGGARPRGSPSRTTTRTTSRASTRCSRGSATCRSCRRGRARPTATWPARCACSRSRATPTTTSRSSPAARRSSATRCSARAASSSPSTWPATSTACGGCASSTSRCCAPATATRSGTRAPSSTATSSTGSTASGGCSPRSSAGCAARTSCSTPRGPTRRRELRPFAAISLRAHLEKLRAEGRA